MLGQEILPGTVRAEQGEQSAPVRLLPFALDSRKQIVTRNGAAAQTSGHKRIAPSKPAQVCADARMGAEDMSGPNDHGARVQWLDTLNHLGLDGVLAIQVRPKAADDANAFRPMLAGGVDDLIKHG